MKHKLILQATLCIGISATMLISSSIVKAQNNSVRGFSGASSQSEYFHRGGVIYYLSVTDSNLRSYCGFASPGHLAAYRSVIAGNVNYRNPPSNTGGYTGPCGLPEPGYFSHGNTTYFYGYNPSAFKDGWSVCGFSNPQSYASHRRANPNARNYGQLDVPPARIMRYVGACG